MANGKIKNKQLDIITDFDINNHRLLNVSTPESGLDAVNKSFVDTKAVNYALGSGLYSGGTLGIVNTNTFSILSGVGFIVNPVSKSILEVNWSTFTGITLMAFGPSDITISIAIDVNGDVIQQIPKFNSQQRTEYIVLGELFIDPLTRGLVDIIFYPIYSRDLNSIVDFSLYDGVRIIEGNNLISNGNNLLLDVSAGKINGYSINSINSINTPNESEQPLQTGITYYQSWYNGSEYIYTGLTNEVDVTQWSNGTSTLQPSTNNKYNLKIFFRSATNGNKFIMLHATINEEFASMQDAEVALNVLGVECPPELFGIMVPLAWIIVKGNTSDLSNPTDAIIIPIQSISVSAGSIATSAISVSYDPTSSINLEDNDVQDALENVNNKIENTDFSYANENMVALTGTSATVYLATNSTVLDTPFTRIRVTVNAMKVEVGNGTIIGSDCYFSDDGGSTAKTYENVSQGDNLYWNGPGASYQLDATDKIDFIYLTR